MEQPHNVANELLSNRKLLHVCRLFIRDNHGTAASINIVFILVTFLLIVASDDLTDSSGEFSILLNRFHLLLHDLLSLTVV